MSADHYIFCGNGSDTNPEPDVVQAIFDSRIGPKRSPNAPNTKFTFWFNSHSSVSTNAKHRKHMKAIETKVGKLGNQSGGKFTAKFLTDSSFPPLTV